MMQIALLGSTGSIGESTLDVVRRYPDRYRIAGLAAGGNVELLAAQVLEFRPRMVSLSDPAAVARLTQLLGSEAPEVYAGSEGATVVATMAETDMVVAAIAGSAGLVPTYSAAAAGKNIALANKETMVMAGSLMTRAAQEQGCRIIPVDSEHSAIFQLLEGRSPQDVRRILLTASGGPFLGCSRAELERVTPEQALNHPRWKMGRKVTTDSATLMNKGLEIIEAHWLFGMPPGRIGVVVHPQSIIHSMVEFVDGTVLAQMSQPDMRAPIAYALSCPERLHDIVAPLDLAGIGSLSFFEPDVECFPTIRLAYQALEAGGLVPAVMNAANEVAVEKFHERAISFTAIAQLIETVMAAFTGGSADSLAAVLDADRWARQEAATVAEKFSGR
ncbi:MAG: 1-deoxy-D-xylulose-5-phosphate reductoisomerase [Proteobacteria bacterium]|nr:1-deoxy-D-xylulose-5-phosphate reductoisomerase [Pseudomonadota bacterium]